MNNSAYNIIEMMTKCIFIYCKGTTTIEMAKLNQLVSHIKDIALSNKKEFRINSKRSRILEIEGDDGER